MLQVLEMKGNTGHSWFHLMTSAGTGLKASESKSVNRGYRWDNNESSRHSALYCGEWFGFIFIIWDGERRSHRWGLERRAWTHRVPVRQKGFISQGRLLVLCLPSICLCPDQFLSDTDNQKHFQSMDGSVYLTITFFLQLCFCSSAYTVCSFEWRLKEH